MREKLEAQGQVNNYKFDLEDNSWKLSEIIEECKKLHTKSKWHMVKDKDLPKLDEVVLTVNKDGWVSTEIYSNFTALTWESGYIVAWMELPESPIKK